jgi:thioredoxin-related protein
MKKIHFIFAVLLLFSTTAFKTDTSKGVNFILSGWSDIVKEAKTQDKPMFIFIRTQTCEISKKMDGVFLNAGLSKFLNDNFVCGQLDPDKPLDNFRVSNWGASAVPTFVFLNKKKKLVSISDGFQDPKMMLKTAQEALAKIDGPAN